MPDTSKDLTPPTDAERAHWQALCDAATEGPWTAQDTPGAGIEIRGFMPRSEHVEYSLRESSTRLLFCAPWVQFSRPEYDAQVLANAEFAAMARTALPRLLAAYARVVGELRDVRTAVQPLAEARAARVVTALVQQWASGGGEVPTEGATLRPVYDAVRALVGERSQQESERDAVIAAAVALSRAATTERLSPDDVAQKFAALHSAVCAMRPDGQAGGRGVA